MIWPGKWWRGGLSVRATEALVKKAAAGEQATAQVSAAPRARSGTKDADTKALEGDLSASLGIESVGRASSGLGIGADYCELYKLWNNSMTSVVF